MRTLQLTLGLVLFLGLSACVSKKKYTELESNYNDLNAKYGKLTQQHNELQEDYANLEVAYNDEVAKYNALKEDYDALYAMREMSEEEIIALNEELNAKLNELQKSQKRIEELEAAVNKQNELLNSIFNKLNDALVGFSDEDLQVEIRDGKVYVSLSDKLLFKSGSDQVDVQGKEALVQLAGVLQKQDGVDIIIEGHTDNVPIKTGVYRDNWDLSVRRATSVINILTGEGGMEAARLTASGRGEYSPVASNETKEGKAKNRRTEIIIAPKLGEIMELLQVQMK